jgi:dCMP deaminase
MSFSRPSWDDYFLSLANMVASRATCVRRKVGALLVKDKRILATGYNGAPSGLQHCQETGCMRDKMGVPSGERHELCRGLHAEQNALIQASKLGFSVDGATLYCTTFPYVICAKMLINAGIIRIVYSEGYSDNLTQGLLDEAELTLVSNT